MKDHLNQKAVISGVVYETDLDRSTHRVGA